MRGGAAWRGRRGTGAAPGGAEKAGGAMTRRTLALALLLSIAAPLTAQAQPAAKVPTVGVLQVGTPEATAIFFEAFKQTMRERGYVEGHHVAYELRLGEGSRERIADGAAELVRLKVAVIVT